MGNHGRMNEWNDIAVLTPPGDIDIATVPALRRRLDALIDRGVRRVVINCQAVSYSRHSGGGAASLEQERRGPSGY